MLKSKEMAGKATLYKLVVLGDGGVGKTALTIQLCLNHFIETYDPTIEDSYRKQVSIDGQSCMLEVLDTAGQEDYTALRDQWVRDGEGFLLVYSVTSRSSFNRVQRFHQHVQRIKGPTAGSPTSMAFMGGYQLPNSPSSAFSQAAGAQVPVMLVGNKSDRGLEREVSCQEGQALARKMGCDFIETSAKEFTHVEKAFYDVVRALRRQRQQGASFRPVDYKTPTISPANTVDLGQGSGGSKPSGGRSRPRIKCVIL